MQTCGCAGVRNVPPQLFWKVSAVPKRLEGLEELEDEILQRAEAKIEARKMREGLIGRLCRGGVEEVDEIAAES